jgi:hypothetical protein
MRSKSLFFTSSTAFYTSKLSTRFSLSVLSLYFPSLARIKLRLYFLSINLFMELGKLSHNSCEIFVLIGVRDRLTFRLSFLFGLSHYNRICLFPLLLLCFFKCFLFSFGSSSRQLLASPWIKSFLCWHRICFFELVNRFSKSRLLGTNTLVPHLCRNFCRFVKPTVP